MRVFVDTCIYEDFIKGRHGVKLDSLKTFKSYIPEKFKLILPKIIKEEVFRGVPQDYIQTRIPEYSMPDVPAGVEKDEAYKEARKLLGNFNKELNKIGNKLLPALNILMKDYIEWFIEHAEKIEEDSEVIEAAKLRRLKGNPPERSQNLGDEIAWELLLQRYSDDDLVIISCDPDWSSKGSQENKLHPFLEREWNDKKTGKKIKLLKNMTEFIRTIDPKKAKEEDKVSEETNPNLIQGQYIPVGTPAVTYASSASIGMPFILGSSQLGSAGLGNNSSLVQCYSCFKFVSLNDYYGLTPEGYKCKFCAGL